MHTHQLGCANTAVSLYDFNPLWPFADVVQMTYKEIYPIGGMVYYLYADIMSISVPHGPASLDLYPHLSATWYGVVFYLLFPDIQGRPTLLGKVFDPKCPLSFILGIFESFYAFT